MQPDAISKYNAARDLSKQPIKSGCYAPYLSMLFDSLGDVRVCCQNYSYLLGNTRQTPLFDIWNGENLRRLREALDNYDFDHGCDYCKWQIREGNYSDSFSVGFDQFPVDPTNMLYPALVEFNLVNTCNLECIMCNGEYSSSIRSRRERLPVLPKAYDDNFYRQLRTFLPHIKLAKCLGGEPFLSAEMYRVWDMMIEDKLKPRCHVNTNGTTFNAKVERILDSLPITFQVSMDGATKETFERIRVNADFDVVRRNFLRFLEYSRSRGSEGFIGLTYCLMRQNWHELGQFLQFADDHDVVVSITPVVTPSTCSLYTLSSAELGRVVEALEREDATLRSLLTRNKPVWLEQLTRLRNRLSKLAEDHPTFASIRLIEPFVELKSKGLCAVAAATLNEEQARDRLRRWSTNGQIAGLVCDGEDTVESLTKDSEEFFGIPGNRCIGRRADMVVAQFRTSWGGGTTIEVVEEDEMFADRIFSFQNPSMLKLELRVITLPRLDGERRLIGSLSLAAVRKGLSMAS